MGGIGGKFEDSMSEKFPTVSADSCLYSPFEVFMPKTQTITVACKLKANSELTKEIDDY